MKTRALLFMLVSFVAPAALVYGAEITTQSGALLVPAGEYRVGDRVVKVAQAATLAVTPAPVLTIANEQVRLSADKPVGWAKGTRLRGCNARDVNACGALVPGSLELRRAKGGERLKEGDDYLSDTAWGHVGIGTNSCVTIKDTVFASYRYSLLRMDTIQVSADGKASLKAGEPHISAPVPPAAGAGCVAIAHVFVNYSDTEPKTGQIYPILETAVQAVTGTTPGRIPKTLAKLKAGGPVKIVCWGDSVTAGGNASKPEFRYPDVFAAGLRERFPQAKIDMQNISAGGSHSRQWLFPEKFPYRGKPWQETGVTWQRIADAKPDLVTLEFVNDAGMTPAVVEEVYSDILGRGQGIGAELVLITPHFTMWRMMGFKSMNEAERRPYVLALREFASKHNIALADAAARWEHLWKEGLPYLTLLHNTINHPDDRGQRLFAEELWKCFKK
ncbi:MAG: GDSL-type esterase/lipase family protein [Verrucomicrobia bacterium]|nr:GDSL-type esterase/lipase family protein [Verrucomicrobiota bacterium]